MPTASHTAAPLKPMKSIVKTGTSYTAEIHGRIRQCTLATFEDGKTELVALCDIITRDGRKYLSRTPR